MIVTYRSSDDVLAIYYYDVRMMLCITYIFSDGIEVDMESLFGSLKEIRRVYRDEIIHDDNIN